MRLILALALIIILASCSQESRNKFSDMLTVMNPIGWLEYAKRNSSYSDLDIKKERSYLRELQKKDKAPLVVDGFTEPPMPSDEENDKTVKGVDSNNNGIRDDIDVWINRRIDDPDFRNALRQLANAKQQELLSGERDDDILIMEKIKREYFDGYDCVLSYVIDMTQSSDEEIQKRKILKDINVLSDRAAGGIFFASTKRARAHDNFESKTKAMHFSEVGTRFKTCKFKFSKSQK